MDASVTADPANRRSWVTAVVVVAVAAAALFFWRLGDKPLENWDEGIHAEVSREMHQSGSWISMTYRDQLYTAKPPLKFWLTTLLFSAWGETEFAIRFWSALAGVLTAALLTWWAWQWSRRTTIALVTGMTFIAGRYVLFHAFRTGETDGLLALFFVAALYAYWRSWQNKRWFIAFGAAVGLAVMTKSFAGLIPVLIAGLDLTISRRWSKLGFRTIAYGALAAAAVALPWHLVEIMKHGREFWQSYFGFHVLERSSEVLYANNVPWYWYAEIVTKRAFPFIAFVPLAVLLGIRRALRERDELDRLLLIWVIVVFALFSLVKTKFDWYILPLYPALALILARSVVELLQTSADRLVRWGFVVSTVSFWAILPLGLAHSGVLWKLAVYGFLPSAASASLIARIAVGVLLSVVIVGAVFVLCRFSLRGRTVGVYALSSYVLLISVLWQLAYVRRLPTRSPLKDIADKVETLKATELDVVGVRLLTQPAGYFYLRRVPGLQLHEQTGTPSLRTLTLTSTDPRFTSIRDAGNGILQAGTFVLVAPRSHSTTP